MGWFFLKFCSLEYKIFETLRFPTLHIYKLYAQEGLSFLKHIDVTDFYFEDQKTIAKVYYNGKQSQYALDFLEFEGFTCVYAI